MKNIIIALICYCIAIFVLVFMISCAPMPNKSKLFPQVKEEQKLEDIQDFKEHPANLWKTIATCYAVSYPTHPIRNTVALMFMTPILGCSSIRAEGGKIVKCHIYYPKGDEYTRTHELNHCRGYADKLF